MLPVTDKLIKVPVLVMLGCAAFDTVSATAIDGVTNVKLPTPSVEIY